MKELQKKIKDFVEENKLSVSSEIRMLDLTSEVGELAKELLKANNYGKKNGGSSKEIEDELGDVLFSTICLANTYNIELEKALNNALEKYKKKDWERRRWKRISTVITTWLQKL